MREIRDEIREVIFRGKRADNGEWIEGSLLGIDWCDKPSTYSIAPNTPVSVFYSVIPETVGQFTGLTDKNGKRIFEGDIVSLVKHDSLIYKVVYVPCRYELVNSKGVNCFVLDIYKSENIEVIGNIHDNPELLGGENNGINR